MSIEQLHYLNAECPF